MREAPPGERNPLATAAKPGHGTAAWDGEIDSLPVLVLAPPDASSSEAADKLASTGIHRRGKPGPSGWHVAAPGRLLGEPSRKLPLVQPLSPSAIATLTPWQPNVASSPQRLLADVEARLLAARLDHAARQAGLHEQLRQGRERQRQLEARLEQLSPLSGQATELRHQLSRAQRDLNDAVDNVRSSHKELAEASQFAENLRSRLREADERIELAQARIAAHESLHEQHRRDAEGWHSATARLERALAEQAEKQRRAEEQHQAACEALQLDLAQSEQTRAELRARLAAEVDELRGQLEFGARQSTSMAAELDHQQASLSAARQQLADLGRQIEESRSQLAAALAERDEHQRRWAATVAERDEHQRRSAATVAERDEHQRRWAATVAERDEHQRRWETSMAEEQSARGAAFARALAKLRGARALIGRRRLRHREDLSQWRQQREVLVRNARQVRLEASAELDALDRQWQAANQELRQARDACRELEVARNDAESRSLLTRQRLVASEALAQRVPIEQAASEELRGQLATAVAENAEVEQALRSQRTLETQWRQRAHEHAARAQSFRSRLQQEAAQRRKALAALRSAAGDRDAAGALWASQDRAELQQRVRALSHELTAAHRRGLQLRQQAIERINQLQQQLNQQVPS